MNTPLEAALTIREEMFKRGCCKIKLNQDAVYEAQRFLYSVADSLESYDDPSFVNKREAFSDLFIKHGYGRRVILENSNALNLLLGEDLLIQASPYLRISRPGHPEDNGGYHRDDDYGGTEWEMNILVPLTDMPAACGFRVLPGSHLIPKGGIKYTQTKSDTVEKSETQRKLGLLYAPKVYDPEVTKKMVPVSLKFGEALLFFGPLLHGCVLNESSITRWSFDIRVCSRFAPIDHSLRPGYYEPFSKSPLTTCADIYGGKL